jgi:beta-lactamase regulating signal transducer with metallopeptidase domain
MMPIAWDAWSSWAAGRLLIGSLQGGVAVVVVWLVCRRFPAIPSSVRAQAWWIVSLGLLLSLSSLPSLPLPLLPAPAPLAPIDSTDDVRDHQALTSIETPSSPLRARADESRSPVAVVRSSRGWANLAMVLWMAGVLVQVFRLVSAYVSLRGAVRRSTPLPEADVAHADRAAVALGLTHTPRIRVSHDIEAPLVTGVVRPVVLIPRSAIAGLSPCERAMVIGHELAHIRRRDLLFAWVPAIAERLLFFHPLARLAAREYAAERESACDALVLDSMDVAPLDYGRMLVRLGIGHLNPVLTIGGSSPSVTTLKRRLDMLHDASSVRSSRATVALVAVVATLAVLPLRVVAKAAATPQNTPVSSPATPTPAPAKPAPAVTPQPAAVAAPRAVARRNPQESASIERAITEQRRNIQQIEEALSKMSAELRALYQRDVESLRALELRRVEENRRMIEAIRQSAERTQEPAGRGSERQTMQFLDEQLRALTAEHDQTSLRLRQLSAEIDSIRQKMDDVRRVQEIESIQKKSDEKK